jgi:hypothetical protein
VGISFAGSCRSGRREATCWRDLRFSFFRMLVTWWCTVCSESTSSEAIWRLVSPRVTRTATSFSRRERLGASSADDRSGAGVMGGGSFSSERAYSTAWSIDIARPSPNAALHDASSSWERAITKYGARNASSSGMCSEPTASPSTSAAPNNLAARPDWGSPLARTRLPYATLASSIPSSSKSAGLL